MPILQLHGVTLGFGGHPLLDELELVVEPRERLCLLGRNGAGKSTLLQVIQGELEPDAGRVVRPQGSSVAYLDQRVPPGLDGTILDVVLTPATPASPKLAEHEALAAIGRVDIDPDARFHDVSAGLKRRTLLARALASEPDLLLLDEPTNHLDLDAIAWLEDFLIRQDKALLFVTHDRAFLRRVATGILDLDRGQLTRYPPDYDKYLERKASAAEVEKRTRAQFDKKLAEEEVWIRKGVRERRKRNQGRVRELMAMRSQRADRREDKGSVRLTDTSGKSSGRIVLKTEGLSYAWPSGSVVSDLDLVIQRGDRIGIVGPNGRGKTTLIRLLLGELEPDAGKVTLGTNLEIAYFDQLHAGLDESKTAAQNINDETEMLDIGGTKRHVIGYLRDFLFTADQARSPIAKFSGGERNRLLLARLFAKSSNLLILDEPTNDLDVETLEVLEEALLDYAGTVLVVSHDRELLDHIVTSLLVLGPDGSVQEVAGGYSDWHAREKARKAAAREAQAPKAKKTSPKKPASTLSKDERKELRELPARIEKLEARQVAAHEAMADPAFFKKSGDVIAKARADLETLEGEILVAYERWEALEAKR